MGHPSKFQRISHLGFVTAATSLNGGQPNFARCLAVSWAGTLYIHFRGILPRNGILLCAKFTLRLSCVLLYWQRSCTALDRWASAKVCGFVQGMELQNFRRGRHLYSTGRPSRWASAHVLVSFFLAYSQRSHIGRLQYSYTWCSLSANLECRSEMCSTRLAVNTGCRNYANNLHLRTMAQFFGLYLRN